MIFRCLVGTLLLLAPLHAAPPPWAIPDAPMRAAFQAKQAPNLPEAGWLLELPELGVTTSNLGDVVLTDDKGQQLPLAKVFRMEAHRALLLGQNLAKDQTVYVYYGGNQQRKDLKWEPKLSLFLETKRLPAGTQMDEWPQLEAAWRSVTASDGAGFVPTISHGDNPFGESANFMSHFRGILRVPDKKVTLYTVSSDASFILANDRLAFAWPGKHSAQTNEMTAPRGEIPVTDGLVKIDYFHAKEGGTPTMVLGWIRDGKLQAIPADAWVQPGKTELTGLEHVSGWPVPQPSAQLASYIGHEGQWLFETRCALNAPLPEGWKARWEWSDGAVFEGTECQRVCVGLSPARVIVRLINGAQETIGARQIEFNVQVPAASIQNPADVQRYLGLLDKEDPARLTPATFAGHLTLLRELGTEQLLGRYGSAWLARNNDQADPFWIVAQLARIRSLAQTNPTAALAELQKFDPATRKKFPQLGLLELDTLVFGLKSPEALKVAQKIGSEQPNTDIARIARIRIGDLYRLLGRPEEARAQYESVQRKNDAGTAASDFSEVDRAASTAIKELLDQGKRKAAEARLLEWEADHSLAKFDGDLLLLRGRALILFGRWNEALQELESFRTIRGEDPGLIAANFYRAQAMAELGRRDEARRIWAELATNSPDHPLAPAAKKLAE